MTTTEPAVYKFQFPAETMGFWYEVYDTAGVIHAIGQVPSDRRMYTAESDPGSDPSLAATFLMVVLPTLGTTMRARAFGGGGVPPFEATPIGPPSGASVPEDWGQQ